MIPLVDPELKSLIAPLSADEYLLLEESVKKEGCRDALVLWKGQNTLLDGHNRFEIAKKNNIPFVTKELEFADRLEVKAWIIRNQLGRRAQQRKQIEKQLKELVENFSPETCAAMARLYQNKENPS